MIDKEYKPIMIIGPYTSGKGLLSSLLDSNEIFTIPMWHDMLISTFYNFVQYYTRNNTYLGWLDNDDRIIKLRRFLSNVDYQTLEQFSLQKKIILPISTKEYEKFEFNFDFYKQTKEFFNQVFNLANNDVTTKNLFNIFVNTFINNIPELNLNKYKYFVSAAEPGFLCFDKLITQMPDIKIIYINRDWLIPFCSRSAYPCFDAFGIFHDKRLDNMIRCEAKSQFYQQKYPNNYKIIEFKNLIENTEKTMRNIIDFIGLEWNNIYIKPTFLTKDIRSQQILGKVIDTKENSNLPPNIIRELENEYRKRKEKVLNCIINIPYVSAINFLSAKKLIRKITSEDISVVIQGAIDKKETKKCLKSIKKYLPDSEIILSTWEGSDVSDLNGLYDKIVFSQDPGTAKIFNRYSNVNRQIVSTISGIKRATRKYVLKLRTDCKLKDSNFLNIYCSDTVQNLKREKEYSIFENRVFIDSYFTRNSEYNSCGKEKGYCFHPSDLWLFGLKEDIQKLFDIPLQEKFIVEIDNKEFAYRVPEQYIWISCLEKANIPVFMESAYYKTPYTSTYSLKTILNNFFVLNHKKTGVVLPKKFKNYDKNLFKYVLNTKRYFELYKSFYDIDFKIPRQYRYNNISDALGVTKYTNELKSLLKPFDFVIKIPKCVIKIVIKSLLNIYKLWWLK